MEFRRPRPDSLIDGLDIRIKLRSWGSLVVIIVFFEPFQDTSRRHCIEGVVIRLILNRTKYLLESIDNQLTMTKSAAIAIADQLGTTQGKQPVP
jgi:hypothetical protein